MLCASIGCARQERVQASGVSSSQLFDDTSTSAQLVSVISNTPPPKDSFLNFPSLGLGTLRNKRNTKIANQPITFRTRIKSSGYGSAIVPMKQHLAPARRPKQKSAQPEVASVDPYLKEYPVQCGPLEHYQEKHVLPPKALHQGAILDIDFSSDAKFLATTGSDKVALVSKLPFNRYQGDGYVLSGHDDAISSVRWSHSNQMVLTTSRDKTSRLWLADSDVASLVFDGSSSSKSKRKSPREKSVFGTAKSTMQPEMVDAMFFYMDKFVLSASGNTLRLHQFAVDELFVRAQRKKALKNDLLNEPNQSRKKRVAKWTFADMQHLTSITCVNGGFLSSVIVAAGSDRSIRVVDAAVGKTVRTISDAHARAPHSVVLPRASCFVTHPSNFYDLLLSSAPCSTIHLWDVRADNCVMRFGEHINRVHPLGVAFSPCMRYVATGSEDRQAYIYDIRTGRCCTKLTGHTDVVTSVAFNPLHPQLATASYDGTVRFYTDRDT